MVSRRRFVSHLVGGAAALGMAGLLAGGRATAARAASLVPASALTDPPIRVRLAERVQEGDDFRSGVAEGVRLPGQGGAWGITADEPGGRYTSAPLELDFPCSHLGLHWQADGDDQELRVEVRFSRDGQRWSGWRPVHVEAHGRDASAVETFGALVGGRSATWAQYRLTFGAPGTDGDGVRRVALTYLDAGRTPRGRIGMTTLGSDVRLSVAGGPGDFVQRVIPREAWGADESLRFVDGKDQWPRAFVSPKLLAVHHTATDNVYDDPAAEVRAIYVYHTVTQGFGDIGYQLLIDNSGQAYEGRLGREADPDAPARREVLSRDVVAGHIFGYNYGSVGIAVLGTFIEADPSPSALQTLEEALAFEATRHLLDPLARADFLRTRRPDGANELWHDGVEVVSGHRDCFPTECPGDRLYARLPDLRRQVAERIAAPPARARITRAPDERNLWPTDLVFGWEGTGGSVEFSTRLEGWRLSDEPDRIVPLSGYGPDEQPIWSPWTRDRAAAFALPPDARGHFTFAVRARTVAGVEGASAARWPLFVDRHVVVDDADPRGVTRVGDWHRSREILGFNAAGYHQIEPTASVGSARFVWTPEAPEDGVYRVLACWTAADNRATNARFVVSSDGQPLATVVVDQRERGGAWVELGRVALRAGARCQVELTNDADGVVVADAVRLVLV